MIVPFLYFYNSSTWMNYKNAIKYRLYFKSRLNLYRYIIAKDLKKGKLFDIIEVIEFACK